MSELKPCPFCGGEAEVYDYEYGIDPAVAYGCKCERCGLAMSGYNSKCEAIEAWNTRHERSCTVSLTLTAENYEEICQRIMKKLRDGDCPDRCTEEVE